MKFLKKGTVFLSPNFINLGPHQIATFLLTKTLFLSLVFKERPKKEFFWYQVAQVKKAKYTNNKFFVLFFPFLLILRIWQKQQNLEVRRMT